MAVPAERLPAHGVPAARQARHGRDDRPCVPGEPRLTGQRLPARVEHTKRLRNERNGLVELDPHEPRRGGESLLVRRSAPTRVACASAVPGTTSAHAASAAASHRVIGARPPRRLTGGRRPARRRGRRRGHREHDERQRERRPQRRRAGRTESESDRAPPISTQPQAWCTNAEREKSHPFCSWTRNATPETAKASGIVRRPELGGAACRRPAPSPAAPASITACAQTACAIVCIVESVKNTVTGHRRDASAKRRDGQRYRRQRRRSQTSTPTIARARTQSPSRRKPVANHQWTCSAEARARACQGPPSGSRSAATPGAMAMWKTTPTRSRTAAALPGATRIPGRRGRAA